MKILKHGNTYKKMKCDNCNCVFKYTKADIKYILKDYSLAECCLIDNIECPECKNVIRIEEILK